MNLGIGLLIDKIGRVTSETIPLQDPNGNGANQVKKNWSGSVSATES